MSYKNDLRKKQNNLCFYCGEKMTGEFGRTHPRAPTIEHLNPHSKTGPEGEYPENHRAACRQCNSLKGNLTYEEFREYILKIAANFK